VDLLLSSGKGRETPALSKRGVSLPSPEDGNKFRFHDLLSCHLKFREIVEIHKSSDSEE
jgi:hypothetical protein